MKVCKRCNLEFDDKFKFCKKCGSILTDKVVRKKEFKIENTEGILVPSERHQIMIKSASKWFFLFFIFLILWILVINNSSFDSQSNSSVRTYNSLSLSTSEKVESVPMKVIEVKKKERIVPNNFKVINLLGRNIYLPQNVKRIREEEKMFDTSSYDHIRAGIVYYGLVDNNTVGENNKYKRYEVIVIFSESPNFKGISSTVERKSLKEGLKGTLASVRQNGDVNLISEEFCENADGHQYLKAKYSVVEKGNLDSKTYVDYILTIYDGKLFGIFLKRFGTLDFNFDFDVISKTFGTVQEM